MQFASGLLSSAAEQSSCTFTPAPTDLLCLHLLCCLMQWHSHQRYQLCGDAQQWDSSSVVFIFFFFFPFPLIFSCKDGFQSDHYPSSHVLIILLLQPHCFLLHLEAVALPLCPTPSHAPGTNALLPLLWRSFQNWNEKDLETIYRLISRSARAPLGGYGDVKLSKGHTPCLQTGKPCIFPIHGN